MTSVAGGRDIIATAATADAAVRQRAQILSLSATVEPGSPGERVVAALFDCIARWGMTKTNVEDVARAAGMSRATLYRLFPRDPHRQGRSLRMSH